MSKPAPDRSAEASQPTYEVQFFPSLAQQRARLAAEADDMKMSELREAAAEVHIDTSGARSKQELVDVVKGSARTVIPSTPEATVEPATAEEPATPTPARSRKG
jgi:hypothetical protein